MLVYKICSLYFYGQEEIDDCKNGINTPVFSVLESWCGAVCSLGGTESLISDSCVFES